MLGRILIFKTPSYCWDDCVTFLLEDVDGLCEVLGIEEISLNVTYELSSEMLGEISRFCARPFEVGSDWHGELRFSVRHRGDECTTHTGRELKLMLEGVKPLAVFSSVADEIDHILSEFAPYVERGDFICSTFIQQAKTPNLETVAIIRTMYCVPNQQWRLDAYRSMWALQDKYGWNNGFERLEGFLLGYEESIDPFFLH